MEVPREVEVVVTTAEFRRGQQAAWDDAKKGSTAPNDALLDRLDPEFAAGYRYEWREYIAPCLPTDEDLGMWCSTHGPACPYGCIRY
jgi:hypothetical protein